MPTLVPRGDGHGPCAQRLPRKCLLRQPATIPKKLSPAPRPLSWHSQWWPGWTLTSQLLVLLGPWLPPSNKTGENFSFHLQLPAILRALGRAPPESAKVLDFEDFTPSKGRRRRG